MNQAPRVLEALTAAHPKLRDLSLWSAANGEEQILAPLPLWKEAAAALQGQGYDHLINYLGMELPESLGLVLILRHSRGRAFVSLRCLLSKDWPKAESLAALYPGANWFEREIFDLFGIEFTGHPGLRRLLLPEDWSGHPLRKDYLEPNGYNGLPTTRPPLFGSKS